MKLSVVIPTRNEAENIENCLNAFSLLVKSNDAELIVVDNYSADNTTELAKKLGAKVYAQGPERSTQRNRGLREATGEYVLFVDADMIVPAETQREILNLISGASPFDSLYIREVRSGEGLRLKARNFERSFYNATIIDGLRVIRRELLLKVGGYDENLTACEDWDLDRRLLALKPKTGLTNGYLIHNEKNVSLAKFMSKKRYYATTMNRYREKWHNDEIVRLQFSPWYRLFGIFFKGGNYKRTLRHPILYAIILLDRTLVGLTYLSSLLRKSTNEINTAIKSKG